MELQRVISVTVPHDASGAAVLISIAQAIKLGDARPGATAAPAAEPAKRGPGRPPKAAAPAPEPEAEETEETEETETEEAGEEIDLGDEPAEPEPAKPAKAPKLTLEKDIIPAFQAYAKKHTREKAGEVLAKYKVKSVRDLPADKYAEILKKLKV